MNALNTVLSSLVSPLTSTEARQTGHHHVQRDPTDDVVPQPRPAGPRSARPLQTAEAGPAVLKDVLASLEAKDDASKPPTADPGVPPTVQELFDAWGTDDARTDLNADGTVNTDDFLALLQQLAQGQEPDTQTPVTLQEIFDAWDTADARADLTRDGTVNTDDVLAFLQQAIASQGGDAGPVSIQDLFDAWGTGDISADLTSDGTVNTDDFLALLSRLSSDAGAAVPVRPVEQAAAVQRVERGREQTSRPVAVNPTRLAERLVQRLEDAGFTAHPPTNIRGLVGQLNLSASLEAKVMQQLASRYVNGLGVDLIG